MRRRPAAGDRLDASVDRLGLTPLAGEFVRLDPLREEHADALIALADDPRIWTWFRSDLSRPEAMRARVAEQIAARDGANTKAAYAVVLLATGEVVGSTGYNEIDATNRAVEIGATWYTRRVWGTAVNPECKLLLMRHAFESWSANRVWLKTDSENARSRAAIERIGARFEGTLRWHMVRRDGSMRDSAVFSVIRPEWPDVRDALVERLRATPRTPPRS